MAPDGAFFTPMLPPYFLVGRAQTISDGLTGRKRCIQRPM